MEETREETLNIMKRKWAKSIRSKNKTIKIWQGEIK